MPDDGVLSLSQRFENIETMLRSIDAKLDHKVDVETFQTLVHRVERVESGETPLGRLYLRQFDTMQSQVNDLISHGSRNAQEATKEIESIRADVVKLQTDGEGGRAVIRDRQDSLTRRYQRAGMFVAGVAVCALVVSIISLVSLLSHG